MKFSEIPLKFILNPTPFEMRLMQLRFHGVRLNLFFLAREEVMRTESRLKLPFLGDHNIPLRRRNKVRSFEGWATEHGGTEGGLGLFESEEGGSGDSLAAAVRAGCDLSCRLSQT